MSSGSSSASPMTPSSGMADTAQASIPREENRPPPTTALLTPTQPPHGHSSDLPASNGQLTRPAQGLSQANSLDFTLEPYNPDGDRGEWTRVSRKKQKKIRQMLPIFERNLNQETFDKYYIIKFPRLDISTKINIIATDKDLKQKIGIPKKITKLANDSLLVVTKSKTQSDKLTTITSLNNLAVIVEKHKSLNYVKGTLRSDSLTNSSEDEILDVLKNQGVIKVERMKTRRNGQLIDTNRYILTFQRTELPPMIQITEWHRELIDLFIPSPMRCLKCQRLGHTKKWCRREEESCSNCCATDHKIAQCENSPFCINCKGEHCPSSKECPQYILKSEILATQTKEHLTYREAEERVRDRFAEEGRSFSSAVRSNLHPNQETRQIQISSSTTTNI